jgi:outer membrane protein insertion porin family
MRSAWVLALVALALALPAKSRAEPAPDPGASTRLPTIPKALDLSALEGQRITAIEIVTLGGRWKEKLGLRRVRVGQTFSAELSRVALQELADTGRFASVDAAARAVPGGVVLTLRVVPRRIVAGFEVQGSPLPERELLDLSGLGVGRGLTAGDLPRAAGRLRDELRRRGFPSAAVSARAVDTDDPLEVIVVVDVVAGAPRRVRELLFGVFPDENAPGLRIALESYAVVEGDTADEDALSAADAELEKALKSRGFERADVRHVVEPVADGARVRVEVMAGPLLRLVFEGNRRFDADALRAALESGEEDEQQPEILADRLRDFYATRGFFDVDVSVEERGGPNDAVHALAFRIHEGGPLRVVAREYPCLSGSRPSDVGSEIDSFLSELPGSELFGAVDDDAFDFGALGTSRRGARKEPLSLPPWALYVPEVYDRAVEHLRDLFRSRGYLSASVGPPALIRRACAPGSPPGVCVPVGPRVRPRTECRYDEIGLPVDEPPIDAALTCRPDRAKGRSCEQEAVLHLPIKLGPRTLLYDVSFEGNAELVERDLALAAGLVPGGPVSQVELEKARRRVLDAYAEEGFAFAEVEVNLDLSPDHTRGRARFVVSERQRVVVSRIDVRGARLTSESLLRSRIALEVGGLFRRSLARRTEERLAQLGVFSSVTVAFQDPYVPSKHKVVIVTVEERRPQYLDVRPGFSTGEGFRVTFEYGHKNVAGQAIQLTLRSQLGYLPNALILEQDVRRKYGELDVGQRLERRNTASVEFPDIGLGPLFRLTVEGVDVRDNARDYGLTKDAAIVTLHFRPERRLSFQVGGSLERNDAAIFGQDQKGALEAYVRDNPSQRNTFRVPEGATIAIAQRASVSWDRRDDPLDATQGTLVSLGAEHVHAEPEQDEPEPAPGEGSVFRATTSDFMRYTGRVAGYVRFSDKGLALALSFRGGVIQQLIRDSRTYPDRLFFLGGGDSIRGFSQDSLIPEDIAEQLLDPSSGLDVREVVIRGGDMFLNPRAELRIPLTESVQTALFVDSGNLWTNPDRVDPFDLRYTTGSGVRIATPIGPLVFDYGFNVDRVLDGVFPSRSRKRTWESLGAFHFSIGVF